MKQLLNKALKVSDNGLPKHLQPTKDSRDSVIEEMVENNYHFWRECPYCGYAGNNYLHCMHDGVQSKCVKCEALLPHFDGECECEFVVTVAELEALKTKQKETEE